LPLLHNLTIFQVRNLQCDPTGHLSIQYAACSVTEKPDRTTMLEPSPV
jgi:hypothetical protein